MTTKSMKKRPAGPVVPAVVYVTYPGKLFFDEARDLDKQIERAAKRTNRGSGMGNGVRDISYDFRRMKEAEEAVRRIKALCVRGLKVKVLVARQCACGNLLPQRDRWCSCGNEKGAQYHGA